MAKTNTDPMSTDELRELLRYFVGNPVPYMQDARYRDLLQTFRDTDNRPNIEDARVSPYTAEAADVPDDADEPVPTDNDDTPETRAKNAAKK